MFSATDKRVFWAASTCIVLTIVGILFVGTPWDMSLTPDLVSYINAARALAENGDFSSLPNHCPHLFPIGLASFDLFTGGIPSRKNYANMCICLQHIDSGFVATSNKTTMDCTVTGAVTLYCAASLGVCASAPVERATISLFCFASRNNQEMPLLKYFLTLPSDFRVQTNGPEYFQLYLTHTAVMFPRKMNPTSRQPNASGSSSMNSLADNSDVLVYFAYMACRTYLSSGKDLNQLAGFKLIYAQGDWLVWINESRITSSP